jgi:predicted ATPase
MPMAVNHQFVRVDFQRFKAFASFSLQLRHFNILVGPNNSGKSTILAAFRILAAAMRTANTRKPKMGAGPNGRTLGYAVELNSISVAEENLFFNYDDSKAATVTFRLSNQNELTLYFPRQGVCFLIADAQGKSVTTPSAFRSQFNCLIGFVPILGPIEHNENLYAKEAARLALFNYRAARNFRNIWFHFPEKWNEFRSVLNATWPGMDVERPQVDRTHEKPRLFMFCPEERIPREIFWAGFGFQVWCQMLTHLVQSSHVALFLIDEPDIYLHSDLQRQLLGLLRNMGPDIVIATHSAEIISEAEADDIVLINKKRVSARRLKHPSQLKEVFAALGSNLNPILTQLAKTRKAVFVEGSDFQILSKFARKMKFSKVENRSDFAVIPVEAFSPERIRSLKAGIEATLGGRYWLPPFWTEIIAAKLSAIQLPKIARLSAISFQFMLGKKLKITYLLEVH